MIRHRNTALTIILNVNNTIMATIKDQLKGGISAMFELGITRYEQKHGKVLVIKLNSGKELF